MPDVVRTLTSHIKLAAVAIGSVALFGGTSFVLVDNETAPGEHADEHATAPRTTPPAAATEDAGEVESTDAEGTRPTDTHGYCVSQAVAAAHAAGKTGQDVAAAAHSCPLPKGAEAAHARAAEKKAAAEKKKAATHGKRADAPGKQGS